MIRLTRKKGQNTLEYVLLITCVVVAFLVIQYYLNRGVQGRVREAADNIGEQFDAEATVAEYNITRSSVVRERTYSSGDPEGGNITESTLQAADTNIRDGSETVSAPVE